MTQHPLLIGIAGGTASGKSTLANALAARIPGRVAVIEQDWYYRAQDHLPPQARQHTNYDHPDAIEMDLLLTHIQTLLQGHPILAPSYDFTRHTRSPETHAIKPAAILVLEGIHALADPRLRKLMRAKIYVDCPPSLRLARRIQRDLLDRGRVLEQILRQYHEHVEPMHAHHVEPTLRHADLVLQGNAAREQAVDQVLALIGWDAP